MVGRIVYLMGHQEKYPQTKFIIGSSALKTEADEGKGGDESEEQEAEVETVKVMVKCNCKGAG